jgi:hypothetical protein
LVRTLRNLPALGLITLSLGVLALWARSRDRYDAVDFRTSNSWRFESVNGRTYLTCLPGPEHFPNPYFDRVRVSTDSAALLLSEFRARLANFGGDFSELPSPWGWSFRDDSRGWTIYVPHWLVALAFALKPKPRLKFSLADLLVLMTFSAVLIAGVAGLSRLGP